MAEFRKLTSEEVFFIFKEEHRLCSPLDPEADPSFDLQPTSTVAEWLDAIDALPWMELRKVHNESYGIEIPIEEWRMAAGFSNEKTMQGIFDLLAVHAKIEVIKPVKILGQTCLSAAVFKSIKKGLSKEGVNTSGLSPSSKIEPVLKKNYGQFVAHINKNFTGVIPEIKEAETAFGKLAGYSVITTILTLIIGLFWNKLLIASGVGLILTFIFMYLDRRQIMTQEGMLTIPGVVTFRDLVNRIVESKQV